MNVKDFANKNDLILDIAENKNRIHIFKFVIPKDKRGQGLGSEVMRKLVDEADQLGKTITLSPSTHFGATSVGRLIKFYKKFNFVENKGKHKDFTISDAMYRLPSKDKDINHVKKLSNLFLNISNTDFNLDNIKIKENKVIQNLLKLAQEFEEKLKSNKKSINEVEEYLGDEWTLSDSVIEFLENNGDVNSKDIDKLLNVYSLKDENYSILLSFINGDDVDNYKKYIKSFKKLYGTSYVDQLLGRIEDLKEDELDESSHFENINNIDELIEIANNVSKSFIASRNATYQLIHIALDEQTIPEILNEILDKVKDWRIPEYIALNSNSTPDILNKIIDRTDDIDVLKAVIENPNITPDLLEKAIYNARDQKKLLLDQAKNRKNPKISEMLEEYRNVEKLRGHTFNSQKNIDKLADKFYKLAHSKKILYIVHPDSIIEQEVNIRYVKPFLDRLMNAINTFDGEVIVSRLSRGGWMYESLKEDLDEAIGTPKEKFYRERFEGGEYIKKFMKEIKGKAKIILDDSPLREELGRSAMNDSLDESYLNGNISEIILGGCFHSKYDNMCVDDTFRNLKREYGNIIKIDFGITLDAGPVNLDNY